MQRINFFTEDINYFFPERIKTRLWIKASIKEENFKLGEINIVFCSDSFLSGLNLQHLNHDNLTDILTFSLGNVNTLLSGDVYISIDRVSENAIKFKQIFIQELRRVIIHGILHMCGYKDKTKLQKEEIRMKEDYYLKKFN